MTVTTKPLSEHVGVEILDVDRDRLLADEALADECLELLDRHGVLVFRELHLDDDTQVAFSKRLGPVERVGRQADGAEIFRVTVCTVLPSFLRVCSVVFGSTRFRAVVSYAGAPLTGESFPS